MATNFVILDSGPLGRLAHRRRKVEDTLRLAQLVDKGFSPVVAEISDYEIRRSLILDNLTHSISELDRLHRDFEYLPITTTVMRRASELWAEARRKGRGTAPYNSLDADVIISAQAESIGAVVATTNTKHIRSYIATIDWDAIPLP